MNLAYMTANGFTFYSDRTLRALKKDAISYPVYSNCVFLFDKTNKSIKIPGNEIYFTFNKE